MSLFRTFWAAVSMEQAAPACSHTPGHRHKRSSCGKGIIQHTQPRLGTTHVQLMFARRLLPGLIAPPRPPLAPPRPPPLPAPLLPPRAPPLPPFIPLTENPDTSPDDWASLLFANLFLPPKPNFSSFFWRLRPGSESPRPLDPPLAPPLPRSFLRAARSLRSVSVASSRATSNRLSSLALSGSAPCRSGVH